MSNYENKNHSKGSEIERWHLKNQELDLDMETAVMTSLGILASAFHDRGPAIRSVFATLGVQNRLPNDNLVRTMVINPDKDPELKTIEKSELYRHSLELISKIAIDNPGMRLSSKPADTLLGALAELQTFKSVDLKRNIHPFEVLAQFISDEKYPSQVGEYRGCFRPDSDAKVYKKPKAKTVQAKSDIVPKELRKTYLEDLIRRTVEFVNNGGLDIAKNSKVIPFPNEETSQSDRDEFIFSVMGNVFKELKDNHKSLLSASCCNGNTLVHALKVKTHAIDLLVTKGILPHDGASSFTQAEIALVYYYHNLPASKKSNMSNKDWDVLKDCLKAGDEIAKRLKGNE